MTATYPKEALEAYGKVFAILKPAIERKGGRVTTTEYDRCQDYPAVGVTQLYMKANRMGAIGKAEMTLLGEYFDEIPGDFEIPSERASDEDQGVWILGAMGGRAHTMTVSEAASDLDVSDQMIGKLIKQGRLDARMVEGRWLIAPHSVARYKDERRK